MMWFPAVAQLLGAVASILWPILGYVFLFSICFCAWLGYARTKAEREAKPKASDESGGQRPWREHVLIDLIVRAYPYVCDDQWDAHAQVILDSRQRVIPKKFRKRVVSSTGAAANG